MQVKKFEAKNMQEALKMVKLELGPDAIILSAKDHKKGFGIGGEKSVELTAAISEESLKKRKYAMAKIRESDKEALLQAPASYQRKYIQKSIDRYQNNAAKSTMPMRSQSYIDIIDDPPKNAVVGKSVDDALDGVERVKNAAQNAFQAWVTEEKTPAPVTTKAVPAPQNLEVDFLKNEIKRLQSMLNNFQQVPQNFVGTHPGSDSGIPYHLSFMYEKLEDAGIHEDLIVEILLKAKDRVHPQKQKKRALIDAWVAKYILDDIQVVGLDEMPRLESFVGNLGAGKTSTLIKYASYWMVSKRKNILLATTDTQKVGAAEQMRIYAQILNVPFVVIRKKTDIEMILKKFPEIDKMLLDTPGVNASQIDEIQEIHKILPEASDNHRIHYVQSCANEYKSAIEAARRFRSFDYGDIIFTKLDESVHHGLIYSMSKKLSCPLHSFGIGPQIPEDFEMATRERVLDLIFRITNSKLGVSV